MPSFKGHRTWKQGTSGHLLLKDWWQLLRQDSFNSLLTIVSTMVMFESGQWLGKNIVWRIEVKEFQEGIDRRSAQHDVTETGFEFHFFYPLATFCKCLFSSPEHNVLRMSYCDRSMSGVRLCVRPSVNNYLKNVSSETGQQISMKLHRNDPWVMHFQKTWKIWILWRTLVSMATERKNFKNLLIPNHKG